MNKKAPGQTAFEAYNAAGANPGKTYDGKPVPTWENLSDDVRTKWAAAEKAAGRLRLEQFPPIAHLFDFDAHSAFGAALTRYSAECFTQSAPLPTRVLLECFEDELGKRSPPSAPSYPPNPTPKTNHPPMSISLAR